jgi:hypothetical protein
MIAAARSGQNQNAHLASQIEEAAIKKKPVKCEVDFR